MRSRLREVWPELLTIALILGVVVLLATSARADAPADTPATRTDLTHAVLAGAAPLTPSSITYVCHDGHLYRELCWDRGPCTLEAPTQLDPLRRAEWRNCRGMSVLGTAAILSALSFGDARSTAAVYDAGGREVNPALAGTSDVAVSLNISVVKLLDVATSTFTIHMIERSHPRLARWLRRLRVVTGLAIIAWNTHQARLGRR